ncbi:MAG: MBL fold metallo-hydrolase [Nitrospirae bacterium]|nr:MBL fold metallo-hydrolase [Nitrospirota bacterium]
MGLLLKCFIVGPLQVNCYVVSDDDTMEAIVIDPGDEPDRVIDFVTERALKLKSIVCTHTHFDHIGGIPEIKEALNPLLLMHTDERTIYESAKEMAAFWGHQMDNLPKPDQYLSEGDKITVGSYSFEVIHTPGHTWGGICLYGEGIIITGDTLFEGSVGRTDLPGGNAKDLKKSFKRLMGLPPQTRVFPGHGPETTISNEIKYNFYNTE